MRARHARLALVGDSADGFPGIPRIGKVTAARLLNEHGPIEGFPESVLADDRRADALLFKDLATLRTDATLPGGSPLASSVNDLEWLGPTPALEQWAARMEDERLWKPPDLRMLRNDPPHS